MVSASFRVGKPARPWRRGLLQLQQPARVAVAAMVEGVRQHRGFQLKGVPSRHGLQQQQHLLEARLSGSQLDVLLE